MDVFITVILIGLAAAYCGRSFYKKFQPGNGCSCGSGCNSCGSVVSAEGLSDHRTTAHRDQKTGVSSG